MSTDQTMLAEDPRQRPNRLWAFANSAFGLWLLSAIFITGVGSEFTRRKEKRAETARTRELVERLDLEASYRFSQVLGRLDRLQRRGKVTEASLDSALALLTARASDAAPPLYPDFAPMSLPAVLAELRRHLPDSTKSEVDWALSRLADGDWTINLKPPTADSVAGRLLESVVRKRGAWVNTNFAYVDCPSKSPFC